MKLVGWVSNNAAFTVTDELYLVGDQKLPHLLVSTQWKGAEPSENMTEQKFIVLYM